MKPKIKNFLDQAQKRPVFASTKTPWVPVSLTEKQKKYVYSDEHYLLYGGSVGSGKSTAALACALRFVDVGGYSALILRKTFPELDGSGGLIDMSKQWLTRTAAHWSEQHKRWTFPSGAVLQFGHVGDSQARYRYDGQEYQCIIWDEADTFDYEDFIHIQTRCRKSKSLRVPLRLRLTANPPVKGRLWVMHEFVKPGKPERGFIHTNIHDNPHIEKDQYLKTLESLPAAVRTALLEGIWEVITTGNVYPISTANLAETLSNQYPDDWRHVLGVDLGASIEKPTTSFVLVRYNLHIQNYVEVVSSKLSTELNDAEMAEAIREYQREYPDLTVYMDHGALGARIVRAMADDFGLPVSPALKQEKPFYQQRLRGSIERKQLMILRPKNVDLIDALYNLRLSTDGFREGKGAERHLPDAMLYAWKGAITYAQWASPEEEEPQALTVSKQWVERITDHKEQEEDVNDPYSGSFAYEQ